jgi:hypothetical protein
MLAAGCGPSTPNPPATTELENPEPSMSPTSETPPEPSTPASAPTVSESATIRETLVVTSVVERYLRAITARDESAAAKFTCRRADGGLLWISSAGRPITLLRVTGVFLEGVETPIASVVIQVDGKPESPLTLKKIDGRWCVWP